MNKNSRRSDFNGKRALNNFWTIWDYSHKPVKQIDWCMYFARIMQWKGRSYEIFHKPVVFVGVQESYWPWYSAYHHQKNTACPGKKYSEQRRSKLVFWCMLIIQNILLNVKKKRLWKDRVECEVFSSEHSQLNLELTTDWAGKALKREHRVLPTAVSSLYCTYCM